LKGVCSEAAAMAGWWTCWDQVVDVMFASLATFASLQCAEKLRLDGREDDAARARACTFFQQRVPIKDLTQLVDNAFQLFEVSTRTAATAAKQAGTTAAAASKQRITSSGDAEHDRGDEGGVCYNWLGTGACVRGPTCPFVTSHTERNAHRTPRPRKTAKRSEPTPGPSSTSPTPQKRRQGAGGAGGGSGHHADAALNASGAAPYTVDADWARTPQAFDSQEEWLNTVTRVIVEPGLEGEVWASPLGATWSMSDHLSSTSLLGDPRAQQWEETLTCELGDQGGALRPATCVECGESLRGMWRAHKAAVRAQCLVCGARVLQKCVPAREALFAVLSTSGTPQHPLWGLFVAHADGAVESSAQRVVISWRGCVA
jgi:hypothetical protein